MGKVIRLTESQLKRIIENTINTQGGFGALSKKQGMSEEDIQGSTNTSSTVDPFVSFLQKQGFKDWSGGKPNSYGMNFHYISRKPGTPANLSCSVGQEMNSDKNKVDINILFDGVIERALREKTIQEYDSKSPVPKIEKLLGKEFDWNRVEDNDLKSKFNLSVYGVDKQTAMKVIVLYNQIRLVGPYSKKNK